MHEQEHSESLAINIDSTKFIRINIFNLLPQKFRPNIKFTLYILQPDELIRNRFINLSLLLAINCTICLLYSPQKKIVSELNFF